MICDLLIAKFKLADTKTKMFTFKLKKRMLAKNIYEYIILIR